MLLRCHDKSYDAIRCAKMHLILAMNYCHKFAESTASNQHSRHWLQPPRYRLTLALKPLYSLLE